MERIRAGKPNCGWSERDVQTMLTICILNSTTVLEIKLLFVCEGNNLSGEFRDFYDKLPEIPQSLIICALCV